jgi:hypothetical protein
MNHAPIFLATRTFVWDLLQKSLQCQSWISCVGERQRFSFLSETRPAAFSEIREKKENKKQEKQTKTNLTKQTVSTPHMPDDEASKEPTELKDENAPAPKKKGKHKKPKRKSQRSADCCD